MSCHLQVLAEGLEVVLNMEEVAGLDILRHIKNILQFRAS